MRDFKQLKRAYMLPMNKLWYAPRSKDFEHVYTWGIIDLKKNRLKWSFGDSLAPNYWLITRAEILIG